MIVKRPDGRRADELRPVTIRRGFTKNPPGSVLITVGDTQVICTASVEEVVPPFLEDTGKGWVTAEYAMLPGSTPTRKARKIDGRATEIKRLIGRSLRAAVDLEAIGPRTIWLDCDVLQADGGTRTVAVTGAYVALVDALNWAVKQKRLDKLPPLNPVAAVSVGIVGGKGLLDLCYREDSTADVDFNVVMTATGKFVEIQGTAEHDAFDEDQLQKMLKLARKGARKLFALQQAALKKRKA